MSKEENKGKVTLNFYHKGVQFEGLDTLMRVYRTAGLSLELVLSEYICLNSSEPLYLEAVERVKNEYNTLEPYTPKEVFQVFSNQEQKMCLLSIFAPEDIAKNLDSVVVDTQTITKKQVRTVIKDRNNQNDKSNLNLLNLDNVGLETVEYDDTYELHKSDKSVLGTQNDVYFVKCKDTSTDRVYYLFVDPNAANDVRKDAIAAIASTMRKDNGDPLTKQEYLELLESET
jgi:hypothetical protein